MKNVPRNLGRQIAHDGFRPAEPRSTLVTEGYKPNPQGGYVAPTQSAPANPPSGGSSGKPASGSGSGSKK